MYSLGSCLAKWNFYLNIPVPTKTELTGVGRKPEHWHYLKIPHITECCRSWEPTLLQCFLPLLGPDNNVGIWLNLGPQTLGASLVDKLVKNWHAMQETPVWFLGWEDLLEKSIGYSLQCSWASLMAQMVKDLPAMQETWVQWLGWEDPLEKGTATHSNILAWRIPWTT